MTMNIIKFDVPTFLRVIELARNEVKNDSDLQELVESVVHHSSNKVLTMDHYDDIVKHFKNHGTVDELAQIRKLGGF
jgi:hypothetical protein